MGCVSTKQADKSGSNIEKRKPPTADDKGKDKKDKKKGKKDDHKDETKTHEDKEDEVKPQK